MKPSIKLSIFLTLILSFAVPNTAYAYIDPGTGSLLLSIIVSIFATTLFFVKSLIYNSKSFFYRLVGKKYLRSTQNLVFYSEGSQYWTVFQPIIEALNKAGESCTYLSSDDNDPGLKTNLPNITNHYIGKGNRAFTELNMLEADICIMTTPGLDVYQLRRSKGVKHYAHIVHAPGQVSLYRRYALDYYDSVFTSGLHQEKAIHALEAQRNIIPKKILHSGCPYYDVLLAKKESMEIQINDNDKVKNILVAPTWGKNGLLTLYGMDLLKPLIESQDSITIRPHPQSFVVEASLMNNLKEKTSTFTNVQWDDNPDNFTSLSNAHILISDYSSIIFDFAFVFERPVLTLDYEPDLSPYDANDIAEKPWEFEVLNNIGKKISLDDIKNIREIVQNLTNDKEFSQRIQNFRDKSIYNFGKSGSIIAEQLLAIKRQLK